MLSALLLLNHSRPWTCGMLGCAVAACVQCLLTFSYAVRACKGLLNVCLQGMASVQLLRLLPLLLL